MTQTSKKTQPEILTTDDLDGTSGGLVVDGVRDFLFPAGTGGLDLTAKKRPETNTETVDQIDLWLGGISE